MKILTCNIRYFGAEDGANRWARRKEVCIGVIRSREPDIVCFQEMWEEQFADLAEAFPGHAAYGMTDEAVNRRPLNSIFYRTDLYRPIASGGYWLSDRPHVAGSKSWGSVCVRFANWIRLEEKSTGREFRVVNTHLDHVSQPARENQARLLCEDASAYPTDYPQILTGDMNCDAANPAVRILESAGWIDTYGAVHGTENPGPTYHDFRGPEYESDTGKMDWVFVRGRFRTVDAGIVRDAIDGRFPSDHYFVSAVVVAE